MKTLDCLCNALGVLTNSNVVVFNYDEKIVIQYNSLAIIKNLKLNLNNISQIKEELFSKDNNTITLEKIYGYSVSYIGIPLVNKNMFFVIGPFLFNDPYYEKPKELYTLKQSNTNEYEFYLNLKKVKTISTEILYSVIYNLINSNFIDLKNNSPIIQDIIEIENKSIKKVNIICENIELTNKRYYYENLKLKYIKLGDHKNAIKYHHLLMSLCDLTQRLPSNVFRSLKNGLYISSGMIRKVVEELDIPPTLLHNLSSKIFSLIEQCSTLSELKLLDIKIIEEYSNLCLFHSQKYSKFSKNIKNALLFIDINKNENISLKNVAEFIGLNDEYFSRLFKKEIKINFKDYIKKIKVETAIFYLKNKNYRIEEIAIKLGYSNVDSFSKFFKKQTGITPYKFKF